MLPAKTNPFSEYSKRAAGFCNETTSISPKRGRAPPPEDVFDILRYVTHFVSDRHEINTSVAYVLVKTVRFNQSTGTIK